MPSDKPKQYKLPGDLLSVPLYRHQPVGIAQMVQNIQDKGYWALFDDCGLGKTLQTIYAIRCLLELGEIKKAVVVVKASLAVMWREEFEKYASDLKVKVLTGLPPTQRTWDRADVIVLNYELLAQKPKGGVIRISHPFRGGTLPLNSDAENMYNFLNEFPCLVALDESQRIKTPSSRTTQTLCALQKYAKARVIATATPEGETPADIWSQIFFLDGGELLGRNHVSHCRRYIKYSLQTVRGRNIYIPISFKNLPVLRRKVNTISTRRTKKQCLDLPDKIHVARHLTATLTEYPLIRSLRDRLLGTVENFRDDEITLFGVGADESVSGYTHQLLTATAVPSLVDETLGAGVKQKELLEVLNEDPGQLLVYCHYRAVVNTLTDWLNSKKISTGKALAGDSEDGLAGFASGKYRVLVGTLDFLKEGVNLQYSSHAVYFQLPWSRITWYQSQDRQHRIGQKSTVLLERFILDQSLDSYQYAMLEAKEAAARYSSGVGGVVKLKRLEFLDALRQI